MSADDDDFDDIEDEEGSSSGDDDGLGLSDRDGGGEGQSNALGISRQALRDWLNRRRSWLLIIGLAVAQGLFALIMVFLRADAKPVGQIEMASIRDLAVDMLGHEVKIAQIYQLIPMRGGKRMTIGLDIVLILGQLPEEQVEGAPRPSDQEMAMFVQTIKDMEPQIRSRVNILLQQIPVETYGSVEVYKQIKETIRDNVNDTLESLDFGKNLGPGIGKRRVTDVLLPMFVRQMM